jgi:plastocyanin
MLERLKSRWLGAALVAAVVGCSTYVPEKPEPTATGQYEVALWDHRFTPKELVLPVGTTVTWINRDVVAHTVTSSESVEPYDVRLTHLATYKHTFKKPGRFAYMCVPHPGMQGVIIVQ